MEPALAALVWLLGPLGLVLLPGCGGEAAELRAGAPVHLPAEAPTPAFGTVWEGSVLEHEFALQVNGSEDLVLRDVTADCGCTVPRLEVAATRDGARKPYTNGDPVEPGQWLFLKIRYDTRGKVG